MHMLHRSKNFVIPLVKKKNSSVLRAQPRMHRIYHFLTSSGHVEIATLNVQIVRMMFQELVGLKCLVSLRRRTLSCCKITVCNYRRFRFVRIAVLSSSAKRALTFAAHCFTFRLVMLK